MQINSQPFGKTEKGENVKLFTLTNDSGATVKITNYGGIITEVLVPDKKGKLISVVLGFDRFEDYTSEAYKNSKPYFGAIIGRFANRIAKGRFEIDGKIYQVPCNFDDFALHGGFEGFDQKGWKAKTKTSGNEVALRLSYLSKHLEEGFPGNLEVQVTYSWNNNCELVIDYSATTDQSTHINLTNHSYFNLNGCKTNVLDHEVIIHSDAFTEVDKKNLPTGKTQKLSTSMDFRRAKKIGAQIDRVSGNCYDHNYILNNLDGSLKPAAEATESTTGIKLEVLTTEPAVQFYSAKHLDGRFSRKGVAFSSSMGFCLETQHFPDSPNQPGFPPTLLKPGEEFTSKTVYKFSTLL
jgi:aldose 1-epimerase